MHNYIGCYFKFPNHPEFGELLIAELGLLGFESFVEQEMGLEAYIPESDWSKDLLSQVYVLQHNSDAIELDIKKIAQENWNQTWEDSFSPIIVDDSIQVRAGFHPEKDFRYDIVITPKMSFGTGHHETTHMMLSHLLNMDLEGKNVLDMGCGTGILAIFSAMKGASSVDAIDIDTWCFENTEENAKTNTVDRVVNAFEGDASLLKDQKYDLIIANINRNILLSDIPVYAKCLSFEGELLLSGFYKEDFEQIKDKCISNSLILEEDDVLERNNWMGLKFKKI
jgi:ribosomal protein L11 methyltransferase